MKAEVFRPKFTTSQSAQEEKAEDHRPETGWATLVEGSIPPTNSRACSRPVSRPVVKEVVKPSLTDKQKRMTRKR